MHKIEYWADMRKLIADIHEGDKTEDEEMN